MKVFISWSAELSKQFAEVLKDWLPAVLQTIRPYFTPSDIEKGARWNTEIAKELDGSDFGILCITRENIESAWLVFEAGALSKKIDKSKVCPVLFGIDTNDIKGPLSQFQCTVFDHDDIKKLVSTINNQLCENKLATNVLNNVFEKWWPDLKTKIDDIFKQHNSSDKTPIRSERELLEEVLQISRLLAKEKEASNDPISGKAIIHMLENFKKIHNAVREHKPDNEIMSHVSELSKSINYIASHPTIESDGKLQLQLNLFKKLSYECLPLNQNESPPYLDDDDIPF